jgi:quinolinate synthase
VRDLADAICSTEKMITYCKSSPAKQFIIVTESGIIHRLQKECPEKEFICAPVYDVMKLPTDSCRCSECKYMKMNTLQKVRDMHGTIIAQDRNTRSHPRTGALAH